MDATEQLMSELASWLDSVLLRGVGQLRLDDVPELERLIHSADRLGMNTLVELLNVQATHIRQYVLQSSQPDECIGSFFRLAAYTKMATF